VAECDLKYLIAVEKGCEYNYEQLKHVDLRVVGCRELDGCYDESLINFLYYVAYDVDGMVSDVNGMMKEKGVTKIVKIRFRETITYKDEKISIGQPIVQPTKLWNALRTICLKSRDIKKAFMAEIQYVGQYNTKWLIAFDTENELPDLSTDINVQKNLQEYLQAGIETKLIHVTDKPFVNYINILDRFYLRCKPPRKYNKAE